MSDELFCWADYKVHSPLYDDPTKWITRIDGVVTASIDDDEIEVAKTEFIYVDIDSAFEHGDDPWYILDIESDTAPFMALYSYDRQECTWNFHKKIAAREDVIAFGLNLIIWDRIEVLPEYRGKGVSQIVWNDFERLFGGRASIAALKAFPLQHEFDWKEGDLNDWYTAMRLDELEQDQLKATNSLAIHYAQLGFDLLGQDGLMYAPL